jgi:hypothetical protein
MAGHLSYCRTVGAGLGAAFFAACNVYSDPGLQLEPDSGPVDDGGTAGEPTEEPAPDGSTSEGSSPADDGSPEMADAGTDLGSPDAGRVECNVASDCGQDTDCKTYACERQTCTVANAPATKSVSRQVPGDCKTIRCDGMGGEAPPVADDTDLPVDGRECTLDVCTNGMPSNPPVPARTPCAGGTATCLGVICGGCDLPTDCPGADAPCRHRTCVSHACGFMNELAGPAPKQTTGDCHAIRCDGSGGSTDVVDDADLPVDSNACTANLCTNGTPSNPELAAGTPCTGAQGGRCASGAKCAPTFLAVRAGDGTQALSTTSTAAFVERRQIDTGALVKTIALPIAANGNQRPLSLSGLTAREGVISLSVDGRYASLLGYATPPGATTSVSTSPTASVNRVVGRIDARDNVDTSTALTTAFTSNNARAAVSVDGTAFWAAGAGSGAAAGLHYIAFGTAGGTQVSALPASLRSATIFGGRLYGASSDTPYIGVFTIGDGLPTTSGATATLLPGVNTPQPYQFVLFDRAAPAGPDTLYVADERAPNGPMPSSGGGIQKWTFNGAVWTNVATFNLDASGATLGVGMRGLAAAAWENAVMLVAISADASANRIFLYVDDGKTQNPKATLLATAAANTVYRSVSLAP